MRIKPTEVYTNAEGKTETKKQAWYYQQYIDMPPHIRTITNLYTYLEKKAKVETLPYKLVSLPTIYRYANRFDWEDRRLAEVGCKRKREHIEYSDYLMAELWQDTLMLHSKSRKQLKKIDWDTVKDLEEDTQLINNLSNMQKVYNQTLTTLTGEPVSLATMYAMIEVLKQTEDKEKDQVELMQSLLHREDD